MINRESKESIVEINKETARQKSKSPQLKEDFRDRVVSNFLFDDPP